jgi:hypothetical protein
MRDPSGLEVLEMPVNVRIRLRKRLRAWLGPEPAERPEQLPTRAPREPPPPPKPTRELVLLATARTFPGQNTGLLGADLLYLPELGSLRMAMSLEALFGGQELSDTSGTISDVSMFWLTGGLMLLWASATRPELSIGPFGSIGYGMASGRAQRADYRTSSDGNFVAVVGLAALLRAELSGSVDAWAGLDFGYVPSGVVFLADQARLAGMADVTLSARVGLSLGF